MMKQLLFMLSLLCATSTLATPVSQEQARQTALQFVQQHFPTAQASSLRRAATQLQAVTSDAEAPYYVFNVGRQQGFVIVSGDDRTVPILGYVDHGDFDAASMPDNMRYFLDEYADAIVQLRALGLPAAAEQQSRRADDRATIEPIVKTTFNQNAPYWNSTPVLTYSGRKSHAATGCVATAMAQVMAAYRHPQKTKAEIPAYQFTFQGETFSTTAVPADSTIRWDLIADSYSQEYSGTPSENAVASLMSLCGLSVQMQYGVNETGGSIASADNAAEALVRYFDFEERTVKLIRRNAYSYANWENTIYAELKAGRPVIYSGQSPTNGHSFICDGYNAEDRLYHVNWGWGGVSDGYFSLMLLAPKTMGIGGGSDSSGYGMSQTAIIGLQPNDDVTEDIPQVLTANYMYPQDYATTFVRTDTKADFTGMKVCYEAWNWTSSVNTYDLGLRIVDSNGNTVQEITDPQAQGRNVMVNGRWSTSRVSASYAVPVNVSGSLPDGTYRIILTCRVSGTERMYPTNEADARSISFSIVGENLYVTAMYKEPVFGLQLASDITIAPDDQQVAGKPHTATVSLKNVGTQFRDDVFYTINEVDPDSKSKTVSYAFFAEVPEGNDVYTFKFHFIPNQQGVNTLRLYAKDNWGNLHLLGTQTITVEGAPDIKLYVTDIENYDTEVGGVVGNTLKVTFKLANEGVTDFSGRYDVILSYSDDDGANWIDIQNSYPTRSTARVKWTLTLPAGQAEEKVLEWKNLNYSRRHRVVFALYENGYYWPQNMIYTEVFNIVDPATIKKPGDLNGDGVVNALDVQEIINACASGVEDAAYDVNADGQVDALDIQAVINLAANNGQQ